MRHQAFFIAVILITMATACSDDSKTTAVSGVMGAQADRSVIQKKPISSNRLPIGAAPIYEKPQPKIDYSKPLTKELEDFMLDEGVFLRKPSRIFDWEDDIHNKPLSHLKSTYDFNKNIPIKSLTDLVSYSREELNILDKAFPDSINVDIKSILDGNTILLNKSTVKQNDLLKADKNGDVKISLMNINCPEPTQKGAKYAKDRLIDFTSIPSYIKSDKKPNIKLRLKASLNEDYPLALVTLDFGTHEFSINRSMVYSGSCFTYIQYNQDRLLLSIQEYAEHNKKGIWSQKLSLIATEEWVMPWDYRQNTEIND